MLSRKEIERQMNLTFFFQSQNKINFKLKHQEATKGGGKKKKTLQKRHENEDRGTHFVRR
jgi:hypothetical protein